MLSDLPTLQSNTVAEKLLATSKQHRKTEATKEEFSKPQDHMQMERNLRETQLKWHAPPLHINISTVTGRESLSHSPLRTDMDQKATDTIEQIKPLVFKFSICKNHSSCNLCQ